LVSLLTPPPPTPPPFPYTTLFRSHQAVQRPGRLVAVAGAELAIAQRQVPIAAHALVVDEDVPRAVHRLDGVVAVLGGRDEHALPEVLPVPGALPQAAVQDLRSAHFLVAVVAVHAAHVLLDLLPQHPAFRVPEHQPRRLFLLVEQIELGAEAAVVAL